MDKLYAYNKLNKILPKWLKNKYPYDHLTQAKIKMIEKQSDILIKSMTQPKRGGNEEATIIVYGGMLE